MGYFRGKVAAITGAGSGIGRALAQQLDAAGCRLWLSDIDDQRLAATRAGLSRPESCDIQRVDVADRAAVEAWAARVGEQSGQLDLLVNNAGVGLVATVQDMDWDDFHWLMNINFWGVAHGSRAFLPLLERSARGHLVNISSMFGLIGVPTQAAYNAAKFAVRGYTEALRHELEFTGSRVRVCCVLPGGVATDIARNARAAHPDSTPDTQHQFFMQHVRTSADVAAAQILRAAERGRPRLLIGRDARLLGLILRLFPVNYPRLLPQLRATLDNVSP